MQRRNGKCREVILDPTITRARMCSCMFSQIPGRCTPNLTVHQFWIRSNDMSDLKAVKGQFNPSIGNAQMMKARTPGAPVLPASVEPVLELLDATKTGTKAKDLETKLHRLVIG